MRIIKGINRRPRKVLLYGTHGIGKTTWASQAGPVIVLSTEDGGGDVGCDRTPLIKDLGTFNGWLSDLATQPHGYRWVCVDTLDWLEKIIFDAICLAKGKANIDDIGYAKGREFALTHWAFVLSSLEQLISARNMGVILLAHSRIVKIEEPELDSYNKYEPDLDKRSCGLLQEWADEVFFARYRVNTISKDEGFNRERTRVVGQAGDRIVYTCEGPGYFAKRRIQMPDQIPLDFGHYLAAIKQAYAANPQKAATLPQSTSHPSTNGSGSTPSPAAATDGSMTSEPSSGNIDGIVRDGSSKQNN